MQLARSNMIKHTVSPIKVLSQRCGELRVCMHVAEVRVLWSAAADFPACGAPRRPASSARARVVRDNARHKHWRRGARVVVVHHVLAPASVPVSIPASSPPRVPEHKRGFVVIVIVVVEQAPVV